MMGGLETSSARRFAIALTTVAGLALAPGAATATLDLSPWKDPAGPNAVPQVSDIELVGPVLYDQPVTVNVRVYNRGTTSVAEDVRVQLTSDLGAVLDTNFNASGDIATIFNDFTDPIDPGLFKSVTFTWTPRQAFPVSELRVVVDPLDEIAELREDNNQTTRAVSPSSALPVPTTTPWGLALLAVLLVTISSALLRRRRTQA